MFHYCILSLYFLQANYYCTITYQNYYNYANLTMSIVYMVYQFIISTHSLTHSLFSPTQSNICHEFISFQLKLVQNAPFFLFYIFSPNLLFSLLFNRQPTFTRNTLRIKTMASKLNRWPTTLTTTLTATRMTFTASLIERARQVYLENRFLLFY